MTKCVELQEISYKIAKYSLRPMAKCVKLHKIKSKIKKKMSPCCQRVAAKMFCSKCGCGGMHMWVRRLASNCGP
jgi:hypothetical protein